MTKSELWTLRSEYLRWENHGTPSSNRHCKSIAFDNFWNVLTTAIGELEPAPAKPTTIADHYPAGFSSGEPCNHCLEASKQVSGIISQLNNAVGLLTIDSVSNKRVSDAKEVLIEASSLLGELFGD